MEDFEKSVIKKISGAKKSREQNSTGQENPEPKILRRERNIWKKKAFKIPENILEEIFWAENSFQNQILEARFLGR